MQNYIKINLILQYLQKVKKSQILTNCDIRKFKSKQKRKGSLSKQKTNLLCTGILAPQIKVVVKVCNAPLKIHLSKRYYPGQNNRGALMVKSNIMEQVFPRPTMRTALVPYNPQIIQSLLKHRYTRDPELAIIFDNNNYFKDMLKSWPKAQSLNENIENSLKYYNCTVPDLQIGEHLEIFIDFKIKFNAQISKEYLISLLTYLRDGAQNQTIAFDDLNKYLIKLRDYFEKNHPSIQESKIFLEIWDNNNFTFEPLYIVLAKNKATQHQANVDVKSETNVVTESKLKSETNITQEKPDKEKTYYEKLVEFQIRMQINIYKMKLLLITQKDNPSEILNSPDTKQWYQYMATRGSLLPLQEEEIAISQKLIEIGTNSMPSLESLLREREDKLKEYRKNSALPSYLIDNVLGKCYFPEDYLLMQQQVNEMLIILHNVKNLSVNDLKLLSRNSGATVLDEEDTWKISQKGYESFGDNPNGLGFKYLNSYPQYEHIMSKIKNKDFLILEAIPPTESTLISVAHQSHKTLIVFDDHLKQNIYVRIGLITSTKENNIMIDKNQVTNPDIDKRAKAQMFRILSKFIVVADDEVKKIDLEMTLFMRSTPNNKESIIANLLKEYETKQNIWSNNPYQLPYEANFEFIRQLTISFLETKLQQLIHDWQKLENEFKILQAKGQEAVNNKTKSLNKDRAKYLQEKKETQYFSLLPSEYQDIKRFERLLKTKMKIDSKRQQKQDKKSKQEENIMKYQKEKEKNAIIHAIADTQSDE